MSMIDSGAYHGRGDRPSVRRFGARGVSPTLTADRTYWHVDGARSWHAAGFMLESFNDAIRFAACGRKASGYSQTSDRLPADAHLCGSCARVIAARTDVES